MAAVPIVIVGTIKDNDSGEEKNVTITGMGAYSDRGVGGGPIIPPDKPPTPPIWGIWGGGNEPFPTPPIYWPGFPIWGPKPPDGGGGEPPKPPLFDWKVGWTPDTGWIVVAIPKFDVPAPSK